jgi:hypothetical protein
MSKFQKQVQATRYIKNLLRSRQVELEPGIVVLGEAEECQMFEYNNRCLAIDTKSGLWVGESGGNWRQVSSSSGVGPALEAIEFLLKE